MSKHKCCILHRTKATNEPTQGMENFESLTLPKSFGTSLKSKVKNYCFWFQRAVATCAHGKKTCSNYALCFSDKPCFFFQHQPGRDMQQHAFLPNWIPTQTEPPSLRDQEKCGSWQKSSDEVSDFSFGHARKEPQKQYWEESMPSPKELPWAIAEKESNISLLLI